MSLTEQLARPVSAVEGFFDRLKLGYKWRFDRWSHLRILPFKSHGTRDTLYLYGRVLDDKPVPPPDGNERFWTNAARIVRRIETDEVPDARIRLRFRDQTLEAETGEDGFFEVEIQPQEPLDPDRIWHEIEINLLAPEPDEPVRATGEVEVPPPDAEFAVVSDMDDTVIRTGASNRLQMARTVLLNNAHTRIPFEGVGAFYRALRKGPDDRGHNPIFYLSSSPWNLYGLFQNFFEVHNIPAGPIFLKDYGFTEEKFMWTSHSQHKLDRLRELLTTYPGLKFVFVGDSGQKDPEIYHEIATEQPERVRAVFIRDVTEPARDAEVHTLAREVEEAGAPMVLAETSAEAAERAAELDLIRKEHVEEVRRDRRREQRESEEPSGFWQRVLGA
jgi:phosphatidate phosphatase APP1